MLNSALPCGPDLAATSIARWRRHRGKRILDLLNTTRHLGGAGAGRVRVAGADLVGQPGLAASAGVLAGVLGIRPDTELGAGRLLVRSDIVPPGNPLDTEPDIAPPGIQPDAEALAPVNAAG